MKILIKTFSSKNPQKIYINFLQKIFKQFLPKIFLRSLKDLQFKYFGDLWKIFILYLFQISWRSSGLCFSFNFEKYLKSFVKWSKMVRRYSDKIFRQSSNKSSKNLFEISWRSQKDFYRRSSEYLKKNS